LMPISGFYPDPIMEKESVDLSANETQPIWITITIPSDASPGLYSGQISLSGKMDGKSFEVSEEIRVKVYPVRIDKTRLWVTNWYHSGERNLEYIFGEKGIEPYSDKYWEYITLLAAKMAEYRQNVAIIRPINLSEFGKDSDGNYTIDFSNFDKTVEIFIEEGVIGRIEGGHIGTRTGGWYSDFVVFVPIIEEDTTYIDQQPISSDEAKAFYQAFMPALTQHLEEKGWTDIYMQHLMDEPIPDNIDTYIEIAQFIKELGPDLKIVEACHAKDLDNTINIWVPQLDYMHQDYDFYKERADAGDEIWFYTCLNPKGEYANRFIELPLLKTRILHWINYRYQIPGYLHWGFDYWTGTDPYDETTSIQLESGTILVGGDAWVVYPGDRKFYSSIRHEAMRDGVVDYELLKMLEETHPEEAPELARQVVYRFDYYDMDIRTFREKRRKILELLSE
ncbi:MAG: DUF4091 domain-containing protein, partial [Bacteroidales bacterium]|nr:DUF4091 domain-containing protein [Bacteroidales bacterium]